MIEPDFTQPIPERIERVHFIGIGGSGMSGIAHMMLDEGIAVERSTFLRVNRKNRGSLAVACERASVSLEALARDPIDAGVPIVVPATLRRELSRRMELRGETDGDGGSSL